MFFSLQPEQESYAENKIVFRMPVVWVLILFVQLCSTYLLEVRSSMFAFT